MAAYVLALLKLLLLMPTPSLGMQERSHRGCPETPPPWKIISDKGFSKGMSRRNPIPGKNLPPPSSPLKI